MLEMRKRVQLGNGALQLKVQMVHELVSRKIPQR